MSLPSRKRGLKFDIVIQHILTLFVASFAEAWIEIHDSPGIRGIIWSLPSRKRGLKYAYDIVHDLDVRRFLRGSVD